MPDAIIEVLNLKMYFPVISGGLIHRKTGDIKAVDDVSFAIRAGETFGLVGESGSGKSTLGMCLLQLYRPTAGRVLYRGNDLAGSRGKDMKQVRRRIQAIFQDPYGSLNPRMNAADIVSEPLAIHRLLPKKQHLAKVAELLSLVGLDPEMVYRYPHEFSAGERQRLGIARALAVGPEFIVCDEPVSSLDVCVQAQILSLLEDLQKRLNLTYLFIAHDLAVVGYLSDRLAVMYRGRIMELGTKDQVFNRPLHPYTRALLSAVPIPDPSVEKKRVRETLSWDEESFTGAESACLYQAVCREKDALCREKQPSLEEKEPGHFVACRKS